MTVVDMLLKQLARDGGVSSVIKRGENTLQIVAGRPDAVCFTLQQEVSQGLTVILAEGFTLGDQIIYDQRSLSPTAIETMLARLIGSKTAQSAAIAATPFDAAAGQQAAEI